jgi:hypothetical protein
MTQNPSGHSVSDADFERLDDAEKECTFEVVY